MMHRTDTVAMSDPDRVLAVSAQPSDEAASIPNSRLGGKPARREFRKVHGDNSLLCNQKTAAVE